jgi:hypothetical protein
MAARTFSVDGRQRLSIFARNLATGGVQGDGRLLAALWRHPWRLPKEVVYLFDWIARMLHYLLHPKPRIQMTTQ